MAYAFLNGDKYRRAKEAVDKAAKEGKKLDLVEEYKKLGAALVEGTNKEIEGTHSFANLLDEEEPKKPAKPASKKSKRK